MQLQTLADAEAYLNGFLNRERTASFDYEKLGLGRIRALCDAIDRPERAFRAIHITGSKGKGTVARAVEQLLCASGVRAGSYTSPHLTSWRERFHVGGVPVGEAKLVAALDVMRPAIERLRADDELRPSFFDVTTALAFGLFRDAGVEVAAVEVGIGGRIDSTNVVESAASVITTVQLEHTDKLGGTLEAIALEKAGIARPGVPLLHGPLEPEAHGALVAHAVAHDVPLEEVRAHDVELDADGLRFRTGGGTRVATPLLGAHQAHNVALAIRAVERGLGRELAAESLKSLLTLRVPACIERFDDVILDSAHTPDSARELARTLRRVWPERPWVLVASVSLDKDAAGIFTELAEASRACVLTLAEPLRSADPAELEPLAWAAGIEAIEVVPDPLRALARARALAASGELVVVAGSLFLAGALRPALAGR